MPSQPQYSKGANSETAKSGHMPGPLRRVPRGDPQPGSNTHKILPWAAQSASDSHASGPGAPTLVDGVAADGSMEVAASDLVLVKIRYKTPNATETDPAREVQASLPGDAIPAKTAADRDTQWAVAVAALAEILKGSPYAEPQAMPQIAAIVGADATRDADRSELAALLTKARALLGR